MEASATSGSVGLAEIIDSHAHAVSDDSARFPPRPDADARARDVLARPFPAEALLGEMRDAGVGQALLVQRGQIYGFDNAYVCAAARAHPGVLFPVCAIDAQQADCAGEARRWADQGAVGFRVMGAPRGETLDFFASTNAEQLWRACAELKRPLCVHIFPQLRTAGLERLIALARTFSETDIVLDHLGNPAITAETTGIDRAIEHLAALPNVSLKFTTIPLGTLEQDGIDSGHVLAHYLALFGAERLLWGSDITQSPGSYDHMAALGRKAVAGFDAATQTALLSGNTRRLYNLPALARSR